MCIQSAKKIAPLVVCVLFIRWNTNLKPLLSAPNYPNIGDQGTFCTINKSTTRALPNIDFGYILVQIIILINN